jgi:hypothetical protein
MNTPVRILAGIIGLLAAYAAYLTIRTNAWLPITIGLGSFEAVAALLAFWLAGLGHIPGERAILQRVLLIGVTIGGGAFGVGFAGPLIFSSGNQGPLLGIFMTGPIGFAVGCIAGFVWTRCRRGAEDLTS